MVGVLCPRRAGALNTAPASAPVPCAPPPPPPPLISLSPLSCRCGTPRPHRVAPPRLPTPLPRRCYRCRHLRRRPCPQAAAPPRRRRLTPSLSLIARSSRSVLALPPAPWLASRSAQAAWRPLPTEVPPPRATARAVTTSPSTRWPFMPSPCCLACCATCSPRGPRGTPPRWRPRAPTRPTSSRAWSGSSSRCWTPREQRSRDGGARPRPTGARGAGRQGLQHLPEQDPPRREGAPTRRTFWPCWER